MARPSRFARSSAQTPTPTPSPAPLSSSAARLVVCVTLAGIAAFGVAAHAQDRDADPVVPVLGAATVFAEDDILATVNGRPIPAVSLENVRGQLDEQDAEVDTDAILDELIDMEILAQAAEQAGLDRRPEIASALMLQYTQTLANAWLAEQNAALAIDDDALRAEYDRQVAALEPDEYRLAHILLDDEAAAREVIQALADGESFDALAKARSIDVNAAGGGQLGWVKPGGLDPDMAEAIAALETGGTSPEPVETDYGWHVFKVEDMREASLPDFEALKPGLEGLAVRRALAEQVAELRDAADVQKR